MPVSFPCGICSNPVASNHRAIQCDICDRWIHIKCNSISAAQYNEMMLTQDLCWCYLKCTNETIPFSDTPEEILKLTLQGKNPDYTPVLISRQNSESFVSLLKELEKVEFNDDLTSFGEPNLNQCLYYTLSEFNEINPKQNSLSFFHQNIASLSLHFDELNTVLSNSKTEFDFIGITETGFNKRSNKHDLAGYRHLDCLTESSKGGVRLY